MPEMNEKLRHRYRSHGRSCMCIGLVGAWLVRIKRLVSVSCLGDSDLNRQVPSRDETLHRIAPLGARIAGN